MAKESKSPFGRRLSVVRGDIKQDEFAAQLGMNKTTYARYEQGKYPPDLYFLQMFCERFNLNTEWLIFGTGPTHRGESRRGPLSPEDRLSPEDFTVLPMLESRVTAGPEGEILYGQIADYYPFKRRWVEKISAGSEERKKHLILLRVCGDSMSPTINQGEIILVDTCETERTEICTGHIYLVIMPDGSTAVKRLVLSEKEGRVRLVCMSDNVAYYRPCELAIEQGRSVKHYVLGRVRWAVKEFD